MTQASTETQALPDRRRKLQRWLRIALVVVTIAVLWVVAWQAGWHEYLTVPQVRAWVQGTGVLGIVVFLAAFCLANMLHVPGSLFMVVAVVAWGDLTGALIAWGGGTMAVTTTFVTIRKVGGRALDEIRHPWMRKILAGLDRYPIPVVFVLRTLMQSSPPLNYTLALTSLKLRHYVIGSALGLILPVAVIAVFTEWFLV